jgi:L-alanine-DL-glutamate epimerase-like enolase superfamily enzyme
MRIVRCDAVAVEAPFRQPLRFAPEPMTTNTAVVVHLEEAGGAIGFGYAPTFHFGTAALRSHVADDFAPAVVGAELHSTPAAVATMKAVAAIAGRLAGTARVAIGILEMALLDLEAQLADMPLHRLWGQPCTPIRAYASGGWRHLELDDLVAFAKRAADRGFDAVKLQVGLSPDQDAARLRGVREAVGPDMQLMLDANQLLPPTALGQWIETLAPFGPAWLEEPVAAENHALLAQLKDEAPFPIAAGESETEEQQLVSLVRCRALDVIQPDAYRVGLNAVRQVRDDALCEGITPAPHMAHEVSAHLLSGMTPDGWLEYFDWFDDWWEEPVVPDGGWLTPTVRPGHGLKLRNGWLDSHRI